MQELERLRNQVAALQRQNAAIPALQLQLEGLINLHGQSKQQRAQVTQDLRRELRLEKEKLDTCQSERTSLEELNADQLLQCLGLREQLQQSQQTLDQTRSCARRTLTTLSQTNLRTPLLSQIDGLQGTLYEERISRLAADAKIAQTKIRSDHLAFLNRQLESRQANLVSLLQQSEADLDRVCVETQQQRRAASSEIGQLKQERTADRHYVRQLERYINALEKSADERRVCDRQQSFLSNAVHEMARESLQAEVSASKGIIQDQWKQIGALDAELVERKRLQVETSVKLAAALKSLAHASNKLPDVQGQLYKQKELQAAEAAQTSLELVELRTERKRLAKRLDEEQKGRQNAKEQLQKAAQAEEAARARVVELSAQVRDLRLVESDYLRLQSRHSELEARYAIAEEEAQQAIVVDAAANGHQNPMQKISHLQNVRNDLAEMKKKYSVAVAALNAVKAENAELNKEIENQDGKVDQKAKRQSVSAGRRRVSILGNVSNLR